MTQKSWNEQIEEFLDKVKFFDRKYYTKFSPPARKHINDFLIGLGLPCLQGRRREMWGYVPHPTRKFIYIPANEGRDIKALMQATIMNKSDDYYIEDVIEWLVKAVPETPITMMTYYYILRERTPFPEAHAPLHTRIQTFLNGFPGQHDGFTSTSNAGEEETSYEEGEEGDRSYPEKEGSGVSENPKEKGRPKETRAGKAPRKGRKAGNGLRHAKKERGRTS